MPEKIAPKYDAVIFDLDGTLTESEPGIVNSVKYSLDQLGRTDYTLEMLKSFIGPPLLESYMDKMHMDEELAREGVRIYRERFNTIGWAENSVYVGIPHLLKSLKQNGVYVGMATAKPRVFAERILKHFGLYQYFDHIAAIELSDMHADKESLVKRALPEAYRRACMVGDREYDMYGALSNGIDAIGALYGYGSIEELSKSGATYIAEDVAALARYLLEGCAPVRGWFVSVEGGDGGGKSTQMNALGDWLRSCGHEVIVTREPGGCDISERIRSLVLDENLAGMADLCEALLFAASRAQHVHEVIEPARKRGAVVLCDRFVDSSVAYQGAGRGLGIELVRSINAPVTENCMPDLTLFFDINPEVAVTRRKARSMPDRIEAENDAFVRRVYEGYKRLAMEESQRIRRVNACGTPEEVASEVRILTMEALDYRHSGGGPLD